MIKVQVQFFVVEFILESVNMTFDEKSYQIE